MSEALGKHVELRKITDVKSVPGSESRCHDPEKGVSIDMGGLATWDGRFSTSDLEVGDVVIIENEGPCLGMIREVFREGLRVYPETPNKLKRILESVEFRRGLRVAAP